MAFLGLTALGAGFGLCGVEWKAMVSTSSDGSSGFSSVYLSLSSSRSDIMGSFRIRRPHASPVTHGRTLDGRRRNLRSSRWRRRSPRTRAKAPRRRGAHGLRDEAMDPPNRRGPRPVMEPVGVLVYSPPSRLRRRSTASWDSRLSRSNHAACFALMRASSDLLGFPMSEWRDSNPRPRCPQPRALPTAPHSVARRPGLEPGLTVLETAVLAIAPPTQRKVSTAPRASARSSGRQMPRTPPKSPEPDSNRRPAAYEAAALPLGHRGKAVPPIAFSMHVESLSARVPCRARHGRDRLVEPAGFGPATFPLRTGCAASAPRPRAIPSLYAREGTVGKGVTRVAALRRWCPRPDSNRRRPP